MSAVIEALGLRNFVGYRETSKPIKFTAGLNLITGRNSTGKSTLLDAIVYGLYGKIPGVDDRLLVSKLGGMGQMQLYLRFRDSKTGEEVEILRAGSLDRKGGFNTEDQRIKITGREIQFSGQEEMRKLTSERIGMGLKRFLNLAYVRQGKLHEILEPKKEDMDAILGITVLRELKEQLDAVKKELERFEGREVKTEAENIEQTLIPGLQQIVEQLELDTQNLKKEVEGLKESVAKAESTDLQSLLDYIIKRDNAWKEADQAEAGASALIKSHGVSTVDELLLLGEHLKARAEEISKQVMTKSAEAMECYEKMSDLLGKANAIENELSGHQKLLQQGVNKCPTCGQEITQERLASIMDSKRKEVERLRGEAEPIKQAYEALKKESDKLGTEKSNLEASMSVSVKAYQDAYGRLKEAERKREELTPLLIEIKRLLEILQLPFQPDDKTLEAKVAQRLPISPEELEQKRRELNEKTEMFNKKKELYAQKKKELTEAKNRLEILKKRVKRAELAWSLAERLKQAIEAVRTQRLKRIALQALKIYNQLTDQQLYSAFEIDPEDYKVYVYPKSSSAPIPAMRTGGGHQTLIALALRLSILKDLGHESILILDEPTYGVDSENLPQLLSHISEASKHVAQVILVTHYGLGEEEASNIVKVDIGPDGSSVISQE